MFNEQYELWIQSDCIDNETKLRVKELSEKDKKESFYKYLEFGTGGLRGLIGDGTNRMNIYTVRHATQGLANFLKGADKETSSKGVAIAYDSRNMSKEFALEAALTLSDSGIKVYLFDDLRTTPELSFTVRTLGCAAGIVITASHNPKAYNGYKVYGPDGCQITSVYAEGIMKQINKVDLLNCRRILTEQEAIRKGILTYIGSSLDDGYMCAVKTLSNSKVVPNIKMVYTPLHGTGLMPIKRILGELGYSDVHILSSQEKPDGEFPTVESPNPEEAKALALAIQYAKEIDAELVLGTDPDCDRVGVAIRQGEQFLLLNGNQIGALLIYYILNSGRIIPENAAVIKTIVTSELGANIAKSRGITVVDTLTGFKYIGEKIAEFEAEQTQQFLFGYEESYGYLAGTFVRDKDAVIASMLISEMASYYKNRHLNLIEVLEMIYKEYGYFAEYLKTITLPGIEGLEKIKSLMKRFRDHQQLIKIFPDITSVEDYSKSLRITIEDDKEASIHLPKSDVIKCLFKNGSWFAVRPSGTEPKIKFYFSAVGETTADAAKIVEELVQKIDNLVSGEF